jgi:hypothetical protein
MAATSQHRDADRLFSRDGRRHFRRRYAVAEVWWGLGVLGVLVLVAGWVAYEGAHPDPELAAAIPLRRAAKVAERGPLPRGLAAPGWHEGPVSQFDASNLYEKINGREGYYKSFGFQRLHFVSLSHEGKGGQVVDIELFDLGSTANALGAYAGERPAEAESKVDGGGLGHIRRNALMMTRGRFYARAIGSEESPAMRAQLEHLRGVLAANLRGGVLPWGYAFFVGRLGFQPSKVAYLRESAFSFGFAKQLYVARAADGDQQLFVCVRPTAEAARALARKFAHGFSQMGHVAFRAGGVAFVKDEYLGALSAVRAEGQWVVGVYRARDRASAMAGMERLIAAIRSVPADLARHEVANGSKQAGETSRSEEPSGDE